MCDFIIVNWTDFPSADTKTQFAAAGDAITALKTDSLWTMSNCLIVAIDGSIANLNLILEAFDGNHYASEKALIIHGNVPNDVRWSFDTYFLNDDSELHSRLCAYALKTQKLDNGALCDSHPFYKEQTVQFGTFPLPPWVFKGPKLGVDEIILDILAKKYDFAYDITRERIFRFSPKK